jgi:hypothetical protein
VSPRAPILVVLLLAACTEYELGAKEGPEEGDSGEPADEDDGSVDDTAPPPDCLDWLPPDAPTAALDEDCVREPTTGSFAPVVEWNTDLDLGYADAPDFVHPYIMPAIGNLTDDNGDGVVDRDDVPDIAYTVFSSGGAAGGVLRVVSGDGSGEVLYLPSVTVDGVERVFSAVGGVALGDIDADGSPDIVTLVMNATGHASVVALERTGALKWAYTGTETSLYSYPSLADLDQDGFAEVVVGHIILDTDGTELGVGAGGTATPVSHPWPSWGSVSIPVDLDQDGFMEIVAGNTVYDGVGATLASSGLEDGFCAIGDIDLDGFPEIVTTVHGATGDVYVWEADGSLLWRVSTGSGGGGPPTVADFDGDGAPEIGVAGKYAYTVLDSDGSTLWQAAIIDESSSATGSSVFDFDGDGASEVVFADEVSFYVFDGATGGIVYEATDHSHGTAWEYPVIADVDNDGAAEIVLGSVGRTASNWNGITVIGDQTGSWAPARPVWNQHAYSITNVDSDLGIPATQTPNWLSWNNFRAGGTELGPSHWLADLVPGAPEICDLTCSLDEVTLWLPVLNGGLLDTGTFDVVLVNDAGAEVHVEAISATVAGEGVVLGPIVVTQADWGPGGLRVQVDASADVEECDEGDNSWGLGVWPCP